MLRCLFLGASHRSSMAAIAEATALLAAAVRAAILAKAPRRTVAAVAAAVTGAFARPAACAAPPPGPTEFSWDGPGRETASGQLFGGTSLVWILGSARGLSVFGGPSAGIGEFIPTSKGLGLTNDDRRVGDTRPLVRFAESGRAGRSSLPWGARWGGMGTAKSEGTLVVAWNWLARGDFDFGRREWPSRATH